MVIYHLVGVLVYYFMLRMFGHSLLLIKIERNNDLSGNVTNLSNTDYIFFLVVCFRSRQ